MDTYVYKIHLLSNIDKKVDIVYNLYRICCKEDVSKWVRT